MQHEHADIQRRQEHQLEVVEQGHADISSGQEVIQHGQEHRLVTEHVLAVVQGFELGQEDTSRRLEPIGNYYS